MNKSHPNAKKGFSLNSKHQLYKIQYPLKISKYPCIFGMQSHTKPGLESQMKELDMYPEDQYFQKYTF